LSVVVVAHDMARELPRTLATLAPGHQRGIGADDYEVVLIDNGSRHPIDPGLVAGFPGRIRLERIDPAPPSPSQAANLGLQLAEGELVGLIVDGARMASPGLLGWARRATALADRPVISSLGWHLGPVRHMQAADAGYDQAVEDELLAGVDWQGDGYELFGISVLNGSSAWGWFEPMSESSALFLAAADWRELGGLDEGFAMPGGGLVNHDVYRRACALEGAWVRARSTSSTAGQPPASASGGRRCTTTTCACGASPTWRRPTGPSSSAATRSRRSSTWSTRSPWPVGPSSAALAEGAQSPVRSGAAPSTADQSRDGVGLAIGFAAGVGAGAGAGACACPGAGDDAVAATPSSAVTRVGEEEAGRPSRRFLRLSAGRSSRNHDSAVNTAVAPSATVTCTGEGQSLPQYSTAKNTGRCHR